MATFIRPTKEEREQLAEVPTTVLVDSLQTYITQATEGRNPAYFFHKPVTPEYALAACGWELERRERVYGNE